MYDEKIETQCMYDVENYIIIRTYLTRAADGDRKNDWRRNRK